jgi:hypothetical protein
MSKPWVNHYEYLDKHLPKFFESVGVSFENNAGIITAHGDKCYSYRGKWSDAGIPFEHGVAIYLLTYVRPFSQECRETENGWKDPCEWVIENYEKFSLLLP